MTKLRVSCTGCLWGVTQSTDLSQDSLPSSRPSRRDRKSCTPADKPSLILSVGPPCPDTESSGPLCYWAVRSRRRRRRCESLYGGARVPVLDGSDTLDTPTSSPKTLDLRGPTPKTLVLHPPSTLPLLGKPPYGKSVRRSRRSPLELRDRRPCPLSWDNGRGCVRSERVVWGPTEMGCTKDVPTAQDMVRDRGRSVLWEDTL